MENTIQNYIKTKLKSNKNKKRILFIDGQDIRAKEAAENHAADGLIEPILLFEKSSDDSKKAVKAIYIEDYNVADKKEALIQKYVERRKGKETREQAEENIFNKNMFAMLLLEMGEVDGVIGGLVSSTAEILKPAFKVVGPKPGIKTISSIMIMEKGEEWYIFSDISVNIDPSEDQLVDIAINAAEFAKSIDLKTKVAFLSFSTSGSAVHSLSEKVKNATTKFNEKFESEYPAIGEVQFDAAFVPEIREAKFKGKGFTKVPTIFVFPDLNSGNIGYKIAQRMGGFGAIGPIITGVNKPINDLSRGSKTMDVYNTALLTAAQCKDQ